MARLGFWGAVVLWFVGSLVGSVHSGGSLNEKSRSNHIRVMFGSCNKVEREQRFWELILNRDPAAWVWMGDNVYADKKRTKWKLLAALMKSLNNPEGFETALFERANMTEMQQMYQDLKDHPSYKLLSKSTQILGTWDDHDYGLNDGDRRFVGKRQSQHLFLDFLDEPADSPRRNQDGVYWTHVLQAGDRTVRVILLDVRFGKTPYPTWPFRFQSWAEEADFLAEDQWRWLQDILRSSTADAHLVVSGLQILPEYRWHGENWGRFPRARERLLNALLASNASGLMLFSGDVHFGEMSLGLCRPARGSAGDGGGGREHAVLEMTTSGMTHSWGVNGAHGRLLLHSVMALSPFRYQSDAGVYDGLNVGQVDLWWPEGEGEGRAEASIVSVDGAEHLLHSLPLRSPDATCPPRPSRRPAGRSAARAQRGEEEREERAASQRRGEGRREAEEGGWTLREGGGRSGEQVARWECRGHKGDPSQWEVYAANASLLLLAAALYLLCPFLCVRAALRLLLRLAKPSASKPKRH